MIDQTIVVTKILNELNKADFSTATVEREIGIASGYLWKVKKGKKTLGEDKLKSLQEYHANNCKKVVRQAPVIIYALAKKENNQPVAQKVIEIKASPEKRVSLASYLGQRPKLEKFHKKIK